MASQSGVPNTAIVGLQWGDEGKGKVVDLLTAKHDVIVRYNGLRIRLHRRLHPSFRRKIDVRHNFPRDVRAIFRQRALLLVPRVQIVHME